MKMQRDYFRTETISDWAISYRVLGDGPRKILFFHGFPGSSVQIELFREHCTRLGLQVICIDRPGYNRTEAKTGSQFEQTLAVVERVLGKMGWSEFEIVSVSGGTPFAFATARALGARVKRVTVVCGLGPIGTPEFRKVLSPTSMMSLRVLPMLPGRPLKLIMNRVAKNPGGKRPAFFEMLMPVSNADRECMSNPGLTVSLQTGLRESVEQDARGPRLDARAFLTPWELQIQDFKGPITFWHGEEDRLIPPRLAHLAHQSLAGSTLSLIPGEGHYSLPIRQMGRILNETA